ncbi:MAG: acyl carrier protein [Candidatus Omnitrophota bacterium]
MPDRDQITVAIKAAISDINETLPRDRKISADENAPLYGPAGVIDSLTLTLLIVAVEQKVEQQLHRSVSLVDVSLVSGSDNSFQTIASLADHIQSLTGPDGR